MPISLTELRQSSVSRTAWLPEVDWYQTEGVEVQAALLGQGAPVQLRRNSTPHTNYPEPLRRFRSSYLQLISEHRLGGGKEATERRFLPTRRRLCIP